MVIALLLLMSYQMVGAKYHEWIGIGMFVLFIIHHILNRVWTKNMFHGKYTVYRIFQTVLAVLILICMVGSMYSGVVLSRYVFSELPIDASKSFARTVHMLAAYWGFIFMGLHLGLHWGIMMNRVKKLLKKQSKIFDVIIRIIGIGIAGVGLYVFISRQIVSYMFLKIKFVFFDFSEPLIHFLAEYLMMLGLFVWVGHYIVKGVIYLQIRSKKIRVENE